MVNEEMNLLFGPALRVLGMSNALDFYLYVL